MIPRAFITAWRSQAPWPLDSQVEQDLVLSRALAEIFSRPVLANGLAFRGGTALHKLHFDPPGRYSEDLDFVQVEPGPIGPLLDELRTVLDSWLDEPRRALSGESVKLLYRFETTALPVERMRVKIEINTREHFSVHGLIRTPLQVANPWYESKAEITSFGLEELLATKMRALYQRKKGRDLLTSGWRSAPSRLTQKQWPPVSRIISLGLNCAFPVQSSKQILMRSSARKISESMSNRCCATWLPFMMLTRPPLLSVSTCYRGWHEGRQQHG